VTGTVLESGNRLQVTAHLLNGGKEPAVWNEKYDRDVGDVLRLQGDLVAAIATELKARVAPERRARLARTIDPNTYGLITRARFLANRATPGGFDKAVAYLTQAVAANPREPLAHASLALVFSLMAHEGIPGAQVKAGIHARKAIDLDPLSAEAHQALANTKAMYEWDLEGAAAEYREAMRLNPNLPDAHAYYSWYLMTRRARTDEQLAEMKKAQSLDPLNPLYSAWLAQMYERLGRYDDALVQVDNALELAPGFPIAVMAQVRAYSGKGMHRQAVDLATTAAVRDPSARVLLAQALVDAGRKDEARRLAGDIDRTTSSDAFDAYYVAYLHGTLGENTQAIEWLQHVVESRHVWAPWIETEFGLDRRLASLRGDARYKALLATVKPLGR
jgi:tetratricopeptide (TPR) repeat protein